MYHVQGLISPMKQRQQNSIHMFFLLAPSFMTNDLPVSEFWITLESQRWWIGPGCVKPLSFTGKFPEDLEKVKFSHQRWNNSPPLLCSWVGAYGMDPLGLAGKIQAGTENRQAEQNPSAGSWDIPGKSSGVYHIQTRHDCRPCSGKQVLHLLDFGHVESSNY